MKKTSVRTRFAPSPTGLMHLGNVRAALVNYLFARQQGGTFILRIEDTDAQRNFDTQGTQIIEDLHWLGLTYDEGPEKLGDYGPYIQSERKALYQNYLEKLQATEHVYRCFCTLQQLEQSRERQIALKRPPRYDRTCLSLPPATVQAFLTEKKPSIWRMKLNDEQTIIIHDMARGMVKFELKNFADFPLTRQDGSFTFLFANAVDDIAMEISHVFRGEDHLSNTALQATIFHALGAHLPTYWHMQIICNHEGKKLSKRDFGFSLADLKQAGFLPEALCNYLILIGGGSCTQEIMSLQEMTNNVPFNELATSGQVRYDVEKLRWVNHRWIERYDGDRLVASALPFLTAAYPGAASYNKALLKSMLQTLKTDMVTLADAPRVTRFYFEPPTITTSDLEAIFTDETVAKLRTCVLTQRGLLADPVRFMETVKQTAKAQGIAVKDLFTFLRLALTGQQQGPSVLDLIHILGTPETAQRLDAVLK